MKTKAFIMTCLLSVFTGSVMAQDKLSVAEVSINAGETAVASIELTNTNDKYVAYQFDLQLPAGVTLNTETKKGKEVFIYSLSEDRHDGHDATITKKDDGSYNFVVVSLANNKIWESSGELLNITLKADESVAAGTFEATLKNVLFTWIDETEAEIKNQAKSVPFADVPFNIILNNATGISSVENGATAIQSVFNANGQRTSGKQKGLNIVKKADGSVQKVIVK